MEFRNLTPFDVMCFSALSKQDIEHPVIVMKVGYRLQPITNKPGNFSAEVIDDDPVPLCLADKYHGEEGRSSVKEESDLAPFKPRCDVIINGYAHAPNGIPTTEWLAGVRLSCPAAPLVIEVDTPKPWEPGAPLTEQQLYTWRDAKRAAEQRIANAPTRNILLDKKLRFHGPRRFEQGFFGWHLSESEPARRVALRWEHAFAGKSVVSNPDFPSCSAFPHLLNQVCYSNPLGCGWMDRQLLKLAPNAEGSFEAPQVEHQDERITELYLSESPVGELTAKEMYEIASQYPNSPKGFGIIGRPWASRLHLAGTYDDAWLKHRWPGLPADFDFGYWNGAPLDQQTAFPEPNLRIELFNLTEPRFSHRGIATIEMPGHRPFILLRMRNGVLFPIPLLTDTFLIDTDAMTLSLTHRISLASTDGVRVIEARFETTPDAPLITRKPLAPKQSQEVGQHG